LNHQGKNLAKNQKKTPELEGGKTSCRGIKKPEDSCQKIQEKFGTAQLGIIILQRNSRARFSVTLSKKLSA